MKLAWRSRSFYAFRMPERFDTAKTPKPTSLRSAHWAATLPKHPMREHVISDPLLPSSGRSDFRGCGRCANPRGEGRPYARPPVQSPPDLPLACRWRGLTGKSVVLLQSVGDVEPICLRSDEDVLVRREPRVPLERAHHNPRKLRVGVGGPSG